MLIFSFIPAPARPFPTITFKMKMRFLIRFYCRQTQVPQEYLFMHACATMCTINLVEYPKVEKSNDSRVQSVFLDLLCASRWSKRLEERGVRMQYANNQHTTHAGTMFRLLRGVPVRFDCFLSHIHSTSRRKLRIIRWSSLYTESTPRSTTFQHNTLSLSITTPKPKMKIAL